ncbi:MAG TPA: LuxR C-terminal-related transcriptional regulator [Anaerolineales bacterium]|nr:LuxR C-terminal-related transcriptional regulator [Anaerolineales bacterium]
MVELLRTKLFIPRPRKNLVFRSRLVDRLNAGLEKKLTLITAPAGFGKTTLLSEWIPKCPRFVTWLFLDEGDNDPTQFWAYFIASLQGMRPDLGSSAFALIQSPQAPPIKSILTELINELTAFSESFASVLDDYHFIDSQPIHEALSFLIDHLPANMHLVITTREDPDLPLARLRARDHLTEIRALDLRFTQEETDAFLRGVMGLDLSRQDVAALEDRTEGWAVGLQLAGLSMQRQADLKSFIADFSGSHRHILDYLTDEVLQQQPEGVRTFLLQTAILERLSGSLCNALTERIDGDKMLAHLEAANLFVIPLDEDRRWYRYHHLFADLLRSQLACSQADLIPELHRRASRWFEENGDIHAAVEHALQASDLILAAYLIERHTLPKLYQGEVARVVSWFDRLPESVLQTAPMLCICKAWALVLMRRGARMGEVEQALHAADHALDRVNAGEALRDLVAGHAASIQAFLLRRPALMDKKPERLIALSQEAQRLLPVEEKAIRSTADLNIGYGYLALADLEAASLAFNQTLEDGLAGGNFYAAIYGPINLAIIAILQGHLREALQLCETYIDRFNQARAGQYFPPIGALYILKGSILLEYDCLAEAEGALTEGLDLVRWTGESVAPKKGYTALARLRAIQWDRPATLETVKTLEETWPEGAFYIQALRHRLLMRHWPGDPQVQKDAYTWLAQSGIEFDKLAAIDSIDPVSTTSFESYLNTAHVLARLAKEKPGVYPLEGVHDYLKRQQDFAASRGFASWVVEIAIARTLLYQAAGKMYEALKTLEGALSAAAPMGLFRIFVDECEPLQALLEELKHRLTGEALIVYASRMLEAMSCGAAKPETRERHQELLSNRELEVLRFLATELTYDEIGWQLFVSVNTVQFHVKNIYRKLQVNKRVQAIEKAREMNLI